MRTGPTLWLADSSKDLCEWVEFFEAAGVPAKLRETYAGIFVEHRINNSVLADLDKDHLKDMGITLSVAPTPVVTSTTSKDCSSENKKAASKNSAKSSQSEVAKSAKTNEPPVSSTFEDSDVDDCDNYRVIISKSNAHGSTSSDSVFSRLGNTVNREDSPTSVLIKKTTDPSAAMQRFIRWNLNDNSLGSPFRPSPSVAETIINSPEDSLNFKVIKQVSGLTKSLDQSVKLRTPLKRHASDTVFSRLSAPSTTIQPNDQLSYQGILKKSRMQPPQFNNESMSTSSLNSFLSPHTEGVLSQSRMQKVSVKNRLGNRQGKSNAPVHSRLGRASNPV
ncbi:unnamed protein product [Schistosoma margrebowiei]|uniref:Uncharacterized protein n=1 Tax=Schistosoma margrebowiei TaxID=48269 RepID=A0A183MLY8_9TREM|nr:unnamed protein product [Schistosoma margrebowiei]